MIFLSQIDTVQIYKTTKYKVKMLNFPDVFIINEDTHKYNIVQQWINNGGIVTPEFTDVEILENAKSQKRDEIRHAYYLEKDNPVTVLTIIYNGGMKSLQNLKIVVDLAEEAGATNVIIRDIENKPQDLLIADAKSVIESVRSAFDFTYTKKQNLMVDIDIALTVEDINLINW